MTDTPFTLPTADEIRAMAPEEAGARLADMAAEANPPPPIAPATAADAKRRLAVLQKDATWSARFLEGGAEQRKEFAALVAKVAEGDSAVDALNPSPSEEFTIPLTKGGELPRA